MAALEFTIGRHGEGIAKAVDKAQAPITGATGFAVGGVVTGPTRALIGEAGRDEMVMPLDNSPQMLDFIDKIADKVGGGGETVVKVYIGDREWDAFTYESAQRGQRLVGAQPIKEGRA
jgi:SLT domain-containing protein